MLRNRVLILMLVLVLVAGLVVAGQTEVTAQSDPDAHTTYQLNMRAGPGVSYNIVATLPADTGVIFEGRNADMSWLLGHTEDGAYRGWVASLYMYYRDGFSAARLPYSDEIIAVQAPAAPAAPPAEGVAPSVEGLAPSGLAPNLESLPIVPSISTNVRTIFQRGQALGNNAHVVTKVGECNSMSWAYLVPFNLGSYDLGSYGYLQRAIDGTTFINNSAAAGAGFTASSVLDGAFADPGRCGGLSPLACEYEHSRPSVAFIMLGMQDVHFLSAQQYEQDMRQIIQISLDHGVIPVLTTFPVWPDADVRTQNRFEFNTILVNLAREYDVPLMNFWLASQSVQHSGVGVDHVHITERGDNWTSFSGDQYQWGMTMWNLAALQTLDQIQINAMN
jgi:lysophospholipase L1-like esterase